RGYAAGTAGGHIPSVLGQQRYRLQVPDQAQVRGDTGIRLTGYHLLRVLVPDLCTETRRLRKVRLNAHCGANAVDFVQPKIVLIIASAYPDISPGLFRELA